jgi:hypothetical protein
LKQTARDPQLTHQLDALQAELFAPGVKADWSPRRLFRKVDAARRSLRRQSERRGDKRALPQWLNPVEDHRAARNTWRTPAR